MAAIGANCDNYAPCGCWIGAWWGTVPPPKCAAHSITPFAWMWTGVTQPVFGPPRLSDEDIERIARRVADLLRESKS